MPITDLTQYADLDAALQEQIKRIEKALIRTLIWCGEMVINTARNVKIKTYKDQTGNLRSSIGAVVAIDGKVVWQSAFEVIKQGYEGSRQGKEFSKSLVSQYPKGIVLICVAGKDYAIHVSNRGLDVLDSSELEAQQLVPEMLATLKI